MQKCFTSRINKKCHIPNLSDVERLKYFTCAILNNPIYHSKSINSVN